MLSLMQLTCIDKVWSYGYILYLFFISEDWNVLYNNDCNKAQKDEETSTSETQKEVQGSNWTHYIIKCDQKREGISGK